MRFCWREAAILTPAANELLTPDGTLVHEIDALPAGCALDVGAGEGGDSVWLAEQG